MLFFFITVHCMDLTKAKWVITTLPNPNAYIGIGDATQFTILKSHFPMNFDDKRIAIFKAVDTIYHEKEQEKQKDAENSTEIDDSYYITIGGIPMCRESKTSAVIECSGNPHDLKTWRIKSVKDGFKIINMDKCLSAVEVSSEFLAEEMSLQLLPCIESFDSIWRIEIMPRNIVDPQEDEDKYRLHRKISIPQIVAGLESDMI